MKEIKRVCVAGAGNMGRQIAANAAVAGCTVTLKTYFDEEEAQARAWIEDMLEKGVKKGRYTEAESAAVRGRISFERGLETAVDGADLVIESILEDASVKRTFFTQAAGAAAPDAILVSNSSYIPSSHFADLVPNPGRLANFHYFNPVMSIKLVEIVRGAHTAQETVNSLAAFAQRLSKRYIVVNREIEGFVVNRLLRAIQDEAYSLYESGIASFEDIDTAAEIGLNHPMGPFRLVDLTGIDINYLNRQKKYEETGREEDRPPAFIVEKYQRGEFGRKTGKGWYTYDS